MKTCNCKINRINRMHKKPTQVYMVINSDWTLRADGIMNRQPGCDLQKLALNKTCKSSLPEGFKVYRKLKDCACEIRYAGDVIILEVLAFGEMRDYKGVAYVNTIFPVRTVSPFAALRLVNDGVANAGRNNKGSYNTGSNNIGDYNSSNSNVGDYNSGRGNHGKYNNGQNNIGDRNNGWNNIGNENSGSCNKGDYNAGSYNDGNFNAGCHNIGCFNCGHYNMTNRSNGAFNTAEPKIYLFDKPSDWTLLDFEKSDAYKVLQKLKIDELTGHSHAVSVSEKDMSEEDRRTYPEYLITGCCTKEKVYKPKNTPQAAWNSLTVNEKQAVLSLPNFDADIFLKITGIRVKSSHRSPAKKSAKTK